MELFLMLLSTPPSRMYKNCLSILKTPRAYFLRRKKLPPGIWLSNHLLKTRECTYYLLLRRVKIGINNCSKRLQSQNSHLSIINVYNDIEWWYISIGHDISFVVLESKSSCWQLLLLHTTTAALIVLLFNNI